VDVRVERTVDATGVDRGLVDPLYRHRVVDPLRVG
jgi:hypothetical protein